MTIITVLPQNGINQDTLSFEAKPGRLLSDALLAAGIEIEHACDGACACSTCHVIIKEGFNTLKPADEAEEDQLDKAWGLTSTSRLACQVKVGEHPITIQLPRYSVNHAKEHG